MVGFFLGRLCLVVLSDSDCLRVTSLTGDIVFYPALSFLGQLHELRVQILNRLKCNDDLASFLATVRVTYRYDAIPHRHT